MKQRTRPTKEEIHGYMDKLAEEIMRPSESKQAGMTLTEILDHYKDTGSLPSLSVQAPQSPTILSITEAYSQSPLTFTVSTELKHSKASEFHAKKLIKVITRQGDRYNGYNFDGQIVFSYLVDSVNVNYL